MKINLENNKKILQHFTPHRLFHIHAFVPVFTDTNGKKNRTECNSNAITK